MDLFRQQNLLEKAMNGNSSMNLPCKYENSLDEIRFTVKFYETMKSGFLTPASYLVRIVQEWNYLKSIGKPIKKPNWTEERLLLGIVGRGLRTLPSLIRELDLCQKLAERLEGARVFRTEPKDDFESHTDLCIETKDKLYRVWSYQNTWRGMSNMHHKFKGKRGELESGYYLLCPYDIGNMFYVEELYTWCLHGKPYIDKVLTVLKEDVFLDYYKLTALPDYEFNQKAKHMCMVYKS